MATPTRRASSRSAPSTARSSKSQPRNAPPSSPLAHASGEMLIDPALLAEDEILQDDLDAEGEVDDGVGYYLPANDYYYQQQTADPYAVSPLPGVTTPLYSDQPTASSSTFSLPPVDYDLAPPLSVVASPISTLSNGNPPKKKRVRRKANGSSTPKPKPKTENSTPVPTPPVNGAPVVIPPGTCPMCLGTEKRNREGKPEKLISCNSCGNSGHPSCLGHTNASMIKKMRSYDWCCIECKSCEICKIKADDMHMLFCDGCDRGWHCYCLTPKLKGPPQGQWFCPLEPEPSIPEASNLASPPKEKTPASQQSSRKGKAKEVDTTPRPKARGRPSAAAKSASKPASREMTPAEVVPKIKIKTHALTNGRKRERSGTEPDKGGSAASGVVLRLRVPSRQEIDAESPKEPAVQEEEEEVEEEEEEEGEPVDPYGGILEGEDADTSRTRITKEDKQLFEKTRKAAEARLGGPPDPLWDPQAMIASPGPSSRPSTPGPSRSSIGFPNQPPPSTPTPTKDLSGVATPTARSLRDRVLLHQTVSLSGLPNGTATPSAPAASAMGSHPERINKIRFGIYDIDTWYQAPYPEEYAQVPDGRLWLCEFCLKYMKSGFVAGRHRMKCKQRHPPGDEIYREGSISVFEVDGRKNKIYCQNLCLLAKMFLDHKTLYYDVEPFLFYVMTEVDEMGARFVGYFSKEKRSPVNNVSCIMTLPVRQRKGWGQLLIDFSYLLSKKEGRVGSPEKPLSGLGALSYKSYWKLSVFQFLHDAPPGVHLTLEDISAATSMTLEDIYVTLRDQDMIDVPEDSLPVTPVPQKRKRGRPPRNANRPTEPESKTIEIPKRYKIVPDPFVIEEVLRKHDAKGYLKLRPDRLKYTPFLTTLDPPPVPQIAQHVMRKDEDIDTADIAKPESGEELETPKDPTSEDEAALVAAGQDKETLALVAALSGSPVRSLRRRSSTNPSPEHPQKRLRADSFASPVRRTRTVTPIPKPKSVNGASPRKATPKSGSKDHTPTAKPRSSSKAVSASPSKKGTPRGRSPKKEPREPDDPEEPPEEPEPPSLDDPEDEEWGEEDAEGEDDDEYVE